MTARPRGARRGARGPGGFTLVEVLVALGIIVVLAGLAVPAVSAVRRRAQVRETGAFLERVKLALASYRNDWGDAPSSRPARVGVPGNGENDGVEALLQALMRRDKGGPYLLDLDPKWLTNADGDRAPGDPPRSELTTRELQELADAWGNPLVYWHNADYDRAAVATLPAGPMGVEAAKSPDTGTYLGLTTWQLWSAGPDGKPGTDDDLRVWGE